MLPQSAPILVLARLESAYPDYMLGRTTPASDKASASVQANRLMTIWRDHAEMSEQLAMVSTGQAWERACHRFKRFPRFCLATSLP